MPADLATAENSSWQADSFLLTVSSDGRKRGSSLLPPLVRTLILRDQGRTLLTSFNPNYFLTPNTVILR